MTPLRAKVVGCPCVAVGLEHGAAFKVNPIAE